MIIHGTMLFNIGKGKVIYMTGLEKILEHIREDAAVTSSQMIEEAKLKEKQILSEAKEEGIQRCNEIKSNSKEAVRNILSRAASEAELDEKRRILKAKQEAIDHILGKALQYLKELPEDEYFKVMLSMVGKYAASGQGEIIFNPSDKERLPRNFEQSCKELMEKMGKGTLRISEQTADISGGFLLSYGEIIENCSFESLFLAEKENLVDKVSAMLFH